MTSCINYKKVGVCGSLWLFSSGLYLTKLAPLSPIHIAFCILCLIVYLKFASQNSYVIGIISFVPLLASLYFVSLFLSSPAPAVLNIIITFTSPLLVYVFFNKKKVSISKINIFLLFYALLFFADGIWRLLNPAELELETLTKLAELGIGFQIYKLNTFMYMDSNFVGLQAVSVLSFMSWCTYFGIRIYKINYLLLSIAIFLTFSRSAMIASILTLFIAFVLTRKISKLLLYTVLFFTLIICSISVAFIFSNDISFLSKFHIFKVTFDYALQTNLINFLFGVGIGNSKEFLGIGAHNLFIAFFIETGFFGLLVLLSILIYWYSILNKGWFILVFPFLLASMSLGTTAIPYLFTMVTFSILLKRKGTVIE